MPAIVQRCESRTKPPFKPSFYFFDRFIDWFYWVVDGIYPSFRIFLKTIQNQSTKREKVFAKAEEAFRKSADKVFAVLFSRWHVLAIPSRLRYQSDMHHVVKCCTIPHNMIVKTRDKNGTMGIKNIVSVDHLAEVTLIRMIVNPFGHYEQAELQRQTADLVEDKRDYEMLKNPLAESIWERYGNGERNDFTAEVHGSD